MYVCTYVDVLIRTLCVYFINMIVITYYPNCMHYVAHVRTYLKLHESLNYMLFIILFKGTHWQNQIMRMPIQHMIAL